jgi:hypothetical protein
VAEHAEEVSCLRIPARSEHADELFDWCRSPRPASRSRSLQHLLTKAAERLRHGGYYCTRLGLHRSWIGDLGAWWDEIRFHETDDTGFFDHLWPRVPRYRPLSVGVVLLGLVPASRHQPDLFAADGAEHQQLSPLVDRINRRYGRCTIGFGLFPSEVREFKGHAAFRRVPERSEF